MTDDTLASPNSPAAAAAAEPAPTWNGMAEQFAREMLRERRSERRWRIFFRLAWLVLMIFVAFAILATRNHATAPTGPHTALIEIRGEISEHAEASAENLLPGLKTAFEDAVPGGTFERLPRAGRAFGTGMGVQPGGGRVRNAHGGLGRRRRRVGPRRAGCRAKDTNRPSRRIRRLPPG